MPYKVDFHDGVRVWTLTDDGARSTVDDDYRPTMYVGEGVETLFSDPAGPESRGQLVYPGERGRAGEDGDGGGSLPAPLPALRTVLERDPQVADTGVERWRQTFRAGPRPVLRVDVTAVDAVAAVASRVHEYADPGAVTCYDVDFSPGFRYCLERGVDPTPRRDLRTVDISLPAHELADEAVARLTVDGERLGSRPAAALEELDDRLRETDPDVLVLSSGELVPLLARAADDCSVDLQLGRRPGWTKLAGESTYTSYGRVGHSPARYDVPGRAIVDRANTFFYEETNLAGLCDLVARSGKPLQELAWASIGNVLTAMQIRAARERGVLVPWRAWRPEFFKTASTLDAADRGGFTFAPEVGVHEDVHELDFASLYPTIICTRNVSPERVRCGCCDGEERGETVPGLGDTVCEEPGYLPDVLRPLVEDRADMKAERAATDDPERERDLSGRISALKWILVSCFGYQGFSNAKFGRIECHEAINAYAREILLDAKETLEEAGWRVVHGIVDSLWVTPVDGREQTPLDAVAARVTDEADIRLEYEAAYDWLAFVPMRDSDAGALTRYFGKRADGTRKYRGIECRQRSTAPFVERAQRDLVGVFDAVRTPEAVCQALQGYVDALHDGAVDPDDLTLTVRVSKDPDDYTHETRAVAALRRADEQGLPVGPGRSIDFVVVDDDRRGRERVRLAHESVPRYDADFYADRLVRAAVSVVSPCGWREADVREYLAATVDDSLQAYGQ